MDIHHHGSALVCVQLHLIPISKEAFGLLSRITLLRHCPLLPGQTLSTIPVTSERFKADKAL